MYELISDEYAIKHLEKFKDQRIHDQIEKMFQKIQAKGPLAGELIDIHNQLYEMKSKRPPLRVYYQCLDDVVRILYVEMKTNKKKQRKTIHWLRWLLQIPSKVFQAIDFAFFFSLLKILDTLSQES